MLATDRPIPTKVIIDFSVLCFSITHSLEPLISLEVFDKADADMQAKLVHGAVYSQMRQVATLDYMDDERPERYHIIYVMDCKKDGHYWRHEYLLRQSVTAERQIRIDNAHVGNVPAPLEATKRKRSVKKVEPAVGIHYKRGRKERSAMHNLVYREMLQCIRNEPTWDYISAPGYEADDLAAAFVHLANGNVPIWLLTIDTDWLGLIGGNVGWFCLGGFLPRVRKSIAQLNEWAERRLECVFNKPSDIWQYKARYGDSSDNLPVFSPIEVIDLLQPPSEYCVWNHPEYREQMLQLLYKTGVSSGSTVQSATHLDKLRKLGIRPIK